MGGKCRARISVHCQLDESPDPHAWSTMEGTSMRNIIRFYIVWLGSSHKHGHIYTCMIWNARGIQEQHCCNKCLHWMTKLMHLQSYMYKHMQHVTRTHAMLYSTLSTSNECVWW